MLLLISITAGLRASEVCVTGDMFLGMRCECLRVYCVYVFIINARLQKMVLLVKASEPLEPLKTLFHVMISI